MERRSKYNAKPVKLDGHTFRSGAEARYYQQLLLRQQAGEIRRLQVHPRYTLQSSFRDNAGVQYGAITWEADFWFLEGPEFRPVVVDVKGVETPKFRLQAMMFRYHYPSAELRIVSAKDV